jgi:hypothetical protein
MSLAHRLDRLEHRAAPGICALCHRSLPGPVTFAPVEREVTPEDRVPCPGCGWPRVFLPDMGSAIEVEP